MSVLALAGCGADAEEASAGGAEVLAFQGGRIDGSDDSAEVKAEVEVAAAGETEAAASEPELGTELGTPGAQPVAAAPKDEPVVDAGGRVSVKFNDLSLDELDDIELEDLLDALLYPDEYEDADRIFPAQIQALDGKEVALEGYMIPVVWEETEVVEFMLVRDLLACCFGGAPQPDEWVSVKMPAGQGSEYFSFVPIVVQGVFRIAALEDEAGYAAGCYRMDGEKVSKSF